MPSRSFEISFDDSPADDDVYSALQELEIEEGVFGPSTLRLRLAMNKATSGAWPLTGDDRFALFTKIGATLTVSDSGVSAAAGVAAAAAGAAGLGGATGNGGGPGPAAIFEGYVTEIDTHFGAQSEDVYLEVRALDTGVLLTLEEKTVSWPNQADSDIVQQIVSDYGLNVQAEDTSPVHDEDETTIVQRGTDAQFIRTLARRNGYEFYFRKDADSGDVGCYFGPPQVSASIQPDLAIQFGNDSNMRSFDVEMSGLRPLAVNVQQIDPHAQSANSGDASDSDFDSLGANGLSDLISGKLDALVTPAQQQGQMLLLAQPTADESELQAVAQAVRDQADWFIKATGEVNGSAYGGVLRAGRLILVKGAGDQFSGKYYLTRVKHGLKNDGTYTQSFEARRNASDLDGSENFGGGGLAGSLGASLG